MQTFRIGATLFFLKAGCCDLVTKDTQKNMHFPLGVILFLQNIKRVHQPKPTLNLHLERNC